MVGPILALGISFLATLFLTRIAIALAPRFHLMDIADERKVHSEEKPIGGIAIFLGVTLGLIPFLELSWATLSLLLGSLVIIIVGLIDDLRSLSPKIKLLGQFLMASIPIFLGGVKIASLDLMGFRFELGLWAIPLTLSWIVGVTNALNLIDGLDGLAAGGSVIVSLFTIFLAWKSGNPQAILLALALLGASLGFLRYNFHPAQVFLGDSGSYFLGFLLAILTVESLQSDFGTVYHLPILVPLFVLGLPIVDTLWAIIRRTAAGKNIFAADRGHIHHRLLERGWGYRKTVWFLYAIFVASGLLGLLLFLML